MPPAYTLQELLDMGTTWQKVEHGVEVSFSDKGYSGYQLVTNAELTVLHPHLVHVLSHRYKQLSLTMHVPWIHSHIVNSTLAYWANPHLIKTRHDGEAAISFIYDIVEHTEDSLTLSVEQYLLDKAGEILYVTSTDETDLVVSTEELDSQFPGWSTRLAVAQSLGEFESLALSYVFTSSPVEPTLLAPFPDNMI
jgi:hypothetical protein